MARTKTADTAEIIEDDDTATEAALPGDSGEGAPLPGSYPPPLANTGATPGVGSSATTIIDEGVVEPLHADVAEHSIAKDGRVAGQGYCTTCGGTGRVDVNRVAEGGDTVEGTVKTCPTCEGLGR